MKLNVYNLFNRPEKNYKPIDGIRAIAVLWVIIFHAWLFQYNFFPNESDYIINNSIFTWISKGRLIEFEFLEGDIEFINHLCL